MCFSHHVHLGTYEFHPASDKLDWNRLTVCERRRWLFRIGCHLYNTTEPFCPLVRWNAFEPTLEIR
jgi:hypothetical protein